MDYAKFKNGSLKVNWEKLSQFIPDIIYWGLCNVNVSGYVEGDETYDYHPYGPRIAPAGDHVDGTAFDDNDVNEFMGCIYELRSYLLLIYENAWEIIIKFVNPSGIWDIHDTFPAAVVLQFMEMEIHMASQQGTSEILSRTTSAFTKIVTDY